MLIFIFLYSLLKRSGKIKLLQHPFDLYLQGTFQKTWVETTSLSAHHKLPTTMPSRGKYCTFQRSTTEGHLSQYLSPPLRQHPLNLSEWLLDSVFREERNCSWVDSSDNETASLLSNSNFMSGKYSLIWLFICLKGLSPNYSMRVRIILFWSELFGVILSAPVHGEFGGDFSNIMSLKSDEALHALTCNIALVNS